MIEIDTTAVLGLREFILEMAVRAEIVSVHVTPEDFLTWVAAAEVSEIKAFRNVHGAGTVARTAIPVLGDADRLPCQVTIHTVPMAQFPAPEGLGDNVYAFEPTS